MLKLFTPEERRTCVEVKRDMALQKQRATQISACRQMDRAAARLRTRVYGFLERLRVEARAIADSTKIADTEGKTRSTCRRR